MFWKMWRPVQGGRVVDAVTRHRDDGAIVLQRVDDEELLFGADPREYGRPPDPLDTLGFREHGQLVGRSDQIVLVQDTGGLGHGVRRQRMVPRDHRDADAACWLSATAPGTSGRSGS